MSEVDYQLIIILLVFMIIIGVRVALYYREKNKINYHNYRSCLMALADLDPKLAAYLEQNEAEQIT